MADAKMKEKADRTDGATAPQSAQEPGGKPLKNASAEAALKAPKEVQTWDPHKYAQNARFVADLGAPLVDLLSPRAGDRVMDLGCGDGALTLKLIERGCVVLGIDSSRPQVDAARRLGIEAIVMDARRLDFNPYFNAVFSNATLHWMKDAEAVIRGVWNALRPGGKFVAEFGGHGCVARVRQGIGRALERRGIDIETINPWFFPTAEEYGTKLLAQGFEVEHIVHFKRPTPLPGELKGWLETFAQTFTAALPEEARGVFLDEVQEDCRPDLCDAEGKWTADYTRVRFLARKPL